MSLRELECAATTDYRFTSRLANELDEDTSMIPVSIRTLPIVQDPDYEFDEDESPTVDDFHLIPGGRFILTGTGNLFQLWDLGWSLTTPLQPYPLASVRVPGFQRGYMCCEAKMEGEVILLVCATSGSIAGYVFYLFACLSSSFWVVSTTYLRLLEICPFDKEPQFVQRRIMSWPVEEISLVMLFPNYLSFFATEEVIVIWNLDEDSCIAFRTDLEEVMDVSTPNLT